MEPVYVGMPPTDKVFEVDGWGEIRCGGHCRDDYARIEVWTRNEHIWKLQHAAMESLKDASKALGFDVVCTGTWRSCELQTSLYRDDPKRFAHPDTTGHCRGLAIDVSTSLTWWKQQSIKKALTRREWYQTRPVDEPWHWSFGIKV